MDATLRTLFDLRDRFAKLRSEVDEGGYLIPFGLAADRSIPASSKIREVWVHGVFESPNRERFGLRFIHPCLVADFAGRFWRDWLDVGASSSTGDGWNYEITGLWYEHLEIDGSEGNDLIRMQNDRHRGNFFDLSREAAQLLTKTSFANRFGELHDVHPWIWALFQLGLDGRLPGCRLEQEEWEDWDDPAIDPPKFWFAVINHGPDISVKAVDWMIDDVQAGMTPSSPAAPLTPVAKPKQRDDWENQAIGLLVSNPGLSKKEIAHRVGCSRQRLYEMKRFRAICEARDRARVEGSLPPKGHKSEDGSIEAYDDESDV